MEKKKHLPNTKFLNIIFLRRFETEANWSIQYPLSQIKLTVMGVRISRLRFEHETPLLEVWNV